MIPIVMCVDDDSMVQMLSKLIFEEMHFCRQLLPADNGNDALMYFEGQKGLQRSMRQWPDLILLDINMPVVDGWGFLEAYTNDFAFLHPGTKVIMLSSSIDPSDRDKSMQFDLVVDFIAKPLSKKVVANLKMHPELAHFFV
jgi:hypothetical protein